MTYSYRFALVLTSVALGMAACGGGGDNFPDANNTDADRTDAATVDTTAPETVIDTPPASPNNLATVHISFSATDDAIPLDVTFACTLDGTPVTPCASPIDLAISADGDHTFTVAATDHAGNTDATPATATWTTDLTPPDTTLTDMPPALDNAADVQFSFTATEAGTFECSLDGGAYAACATMHDVTGLPNGAHTFDVRAIDAVGNVDPTPAHWDWSIDLSTPNTVIDSGPVGSVQATTAVFTFSSPNAGAGATFDCALDAAALAPCGSTSTITYTGLAEGDHTFTVRVTNMAGTPDPTPEQQGWNVDHTAPVVTITSGPTGVTNDSTPSFDFTATGNPTTVECKIDTGAFAACTSPFSMALADGAHTLTVRATDAAGNVGTDAQAFSIDTGLPDTTIVTGPASPTSTTTAAFTFTSTEAGTFECALDGAAFAACATPKSYASLIDGMHTLLVRAKDTAGNLDATPASYAWTVDTIAPDTTIATKPTDPSTVATATFTYTSNETAVTYECKLDGAAFAACPTSNPTYSGLAEGSHTFQVRARDGANNVDATPASYTWLVDTLAPTTTIVTKPSDPSNVATATFTYTSNESGATFECALDGAAFAACPASNPTYSGLAEGSHTFQVRARDAANNVDASPATYTWTVDTIAPDTTIGAKPTDPSNVATATFTYTSSEAAVTYECKLDGAAFVACPTSNPTYSGLAEGSHTFQVRARDAANNVDASPATYTWLVDTLAPTTTIVTKPTDPSTVATASFTYTSNESGVTFECALDGAAFASCPTGNPNYSGLAEGSHTFQVRARDAANNVDASPATYTWKVDTVPPDTTIGAKPTDPSNVATASFTYTSNESGVTFECALDGAAFASCPTTN
ncbi:MAG: cell envelope biogenesis protein OmpA, partial [Deltaproteobacteria bacterium]|nr:cell envelope biogenesis protein OmpA [Deltaproteobacteria bacterium]